MTEDEKKTVKRVKTGSFERRWSLASAGVVASARAATSMWGSLLLPKDQREDSRRKILAKEAQYIADELGKLKGSVVKVGQVMAIYGEHILPPEVTTALRSLEENTSPVDWEVLEPMVEAELGLSFDDLVIESKPIGAASLGQVHKAVIKATGEIICLKVQYPGVAEAIDSDLHDVAMLLKFAKVVTMGKDFDDWLEEVRQMLHREVDYQLEARTTEDFARLLCDDSRFVVPKVYHRYTTDKVLATSYEPGWAVTDPAVAALPQSVRNRLGESFLELFLEEVFTWSTLQTDPNFGNYRIRSEPESESGARIVLLDFGAVQQYSQDFLGPVKAMVLGAFLREHQRVIDGAVALNIVKSDFPEDVLCEFAEVCFSIIEPLNYDATVLEPVLLNENGDYCWAESNLPKRVAKQATRAAISRYFAIPPKEFTFLSRKLLGVFGFISALNAEFNAKNLMGRYLIHLES